MKSNVSLIIFLILTISCQGSDKKESAGDQKVKKTDSSDKISKKSDASKKVDSIPVVDNKKTTVKDHGIPKLAKRKTTIKNKGKAPFQKLRYKFTKDYESDFGMTISSKTKIQAGGQEINHGSVPDMKISMHLRAKEIKPGPILSVEYTTTSFVMLPSPGITAAQLESGNNALNILKNVKLYSEIDNIGQTLSLKLDIPATIPPHQRNIMENMQAQFENFQVPFPSEAVGEGAEWVSTMQTFSSHILVDNTLYFKLVKLDKDGVTLEVKYEQRAASQEYPSNMLPPGTTMTLNKLEGSGKGTIKIKFNDIAADSKVHITVKTENTVSNKSGKSEKMNMNNEILVVTHGKKLK
ncbi:hypothetical protein KKF34_12250 [Myxococcota bacterium]|nr:hypothetical protein [Myxococcota bacterium]MBU1379434.1 hypothetical protein [Myxococcota bacterium]MBU1497636.1 hypothetical protein [Myxococcota bacterium]